MSARNRMFRRPGAGFVYLVVMVALTAGFLCWGLSSNRYDRLWWMMTTVRAGQGYQLTSYEQEELEKELLRYPVLSQELVGDSRGRLLSDRKGWLSQGNHGMLVYDPGEGAVGIGLWAESSHGGCAGTTRIRVHTQDGVWPMELAQGREVRLVLPSVPLGQPLVWRIEIEACSGGEQPDVAIRLEPLEDRDE